MADSFAFANRGKIYIVGSDAVPTEVEIGVIKDCDLTWSAEHVPLYGWGTIKRVAVAKHSQKVTVKIGYMKFDPVKSTGWMWHALSTYTEATATWSTSNGSITDTNAVKLFNIRAKWTLESGAILQGKVTNVYFPDIPLKASEGQWVRVDMTGEGDNITWDNVGTA